MKIKDVRTHVLEAALRSLFSWSLGAARFASTKSSRRRLRSGVQEAI
jgi:hypothetical protein